MDRQTFLDELVGSNYFLFNATPQVDLLIPLIPNPNPIPTRWTECNPLETKCILILTSQCQLCRGGWTNGRMDRGKAIYPLFIERGGHKNIIVIHSLSGSLCCL